MTTTSLLPPAYLLPAWTQIQLALLASQIAPYRYRTRFILSKPRQQAQRFASTSENPWRGPILLDGRKGQRLVLSYAQRREELSEKGVQEIEKRILKEDNVYIRRTNSSPRSHEKTIEARMTADYLKSSASIVKRKVSSTSASPRMNLGPEDDDGDGDIRAAAVEERQPPPPISRIIQRSSMRLDETSKEAQLPISTHISRDSGSAPAPDTKRDQPDRVATQVPTMAVSYDGFKQVQQQLEARSEDKRRSRKIVSQDAPQKSLLEELFPEEISKLKTSQNSKIENTQHAEPPQLALPRVDDMQDENILGGRRQVSPRNINSTPNEPMKPVPALLILENALPNLEEADFNRVSPKGKHIEEWKSLFNPSAIIPARQDHNGECTGKYYLIFESLAHAKAWRTRLNLLHEIFKSHAAKSIVTPLIPNKGFITKGEDIGETLREYSIFSTGTVPMTKLHKDPESDPDLTDDMNMIHARLKPSSGIFQPGRTVLLWIDGWTIGSIDVIKNMLSTDGRARNMPWGESAHHNIVADYHNQIPRVPDKDRDHQTRSRSNPRKWLILLNDEAEARRFIRSWHMRPFPAWLEHKSDDYDEPWPLVRTELMW